MNELLFLDNKHNLAKGSELIVNISKHTNTKEQLINELNEKLKLPDYFGFNWDALYECLNDLSWIDQKQITIIHEQTPNITENELVIYLDILTSTILNWGHDPSHDFQVIFPSKEKDKITTLLKLK